MRKTFAALSAALVVVVAAEFFFAASGAYGTATDEDAYRPHHVLGYVIFLLPVVMAIVAALARMPGRLIWMAALVAGLTGAQVAIAKVARAVGDGAVGQYIFGLHAITGLVLLAVVAMIGRQSWALVRGEAGVGHRINSDSADDLRAGEPSELRP